MFKNKKKKRNIIYLGILLLVVSLTIGFSAFQNELFINDMMLKVRLQRDVRVSDSVISKASNAVVNVEEFNKTKLLGNVTFDSTSSYVLYKVNLTNYGNVKSGLLKFGNTSGFNVSICDSNGSNCTTNYETAICNGSNCTLGSTKEIYVKVSPTSAGTKEINLDLDIEPYVNITYENVRENTSGFRTEILAGDTYQITLTSKPEEVEVSGSATVNYNKNTGVLTISEINSDLNIHAKYLINEIADYTYDGSDPDNYVRFNNELFRIVTKGDQDDGYGNFEYRTKIIKSESIGKYAFDTNGENEFVKIDYFLFDNSVDDELDDDKIEEMTLCSKCGSIHSSKDLNARECDCDKIYKRNIYRVIQVNKKEGYDLYNNIRKCPCCGNKGKSGVVKGLNLGKDEGTALIAQILFEAIDNIEKDKKVIDTKPKLSLSLKKITDDKNEKEGDYKQFLCFSDSRQQASFSAAFFNSFKLSPPSFSKRASTKIIATRDSATTAHAGTAQVSERSK